MLARLCRHAHTRTLVCVGARTHARLFTLACTHTRKHNIDLRARAIARANMRTHAGMHTQALYMPTHRRTHTYPLARMYACVNASMSKRAHTFIYPRMRRQHIRAHTFARACVNAHTDACSWRRQHTCTYAQ